MPNQGSILLAIVLLFMLGACAASPKITVRDDPEVDFARYSTFGYFDRLGTDRAGYRSLISESLRSATTRELEARGFTYDPHNPDLLINFSARLDTRWLTRKAPVSVWTDGYYGYRSGMYSVPTLYSTEVIEYPEGTLNVDVVDARQARLVWEGIAVGRPAREDHDELDREISRTIAKIFDRFPVPRQTPSDT